MNCLIEWCFYLTAAIGLQYGNAYDGLEYYEVRNNGNQYGAMLGRAEVVAWRGYAYAKLVHASGTGTEEGDGGINTIIGGVQAHIGPLHLYGGIGSQGDWVTTNDYGSTLIELGGRVSAGPVFFELSTLDRMSAAWVGIRAEF